MGLSDRWGKKRLEMEEGEKYDRWEVNWQIILRVGNGGVSRALRRSPSNDRCVVSRLKIHNTLTNYQMFCLKNVSLFF